MRWVFLFIFIYVLPCAAGVRIEKTVTIRGPQKSESFHTTLLLDGNRLRLESGRNQKTAITIINGDKKAVYNIAPSEKNYFEAPLNEARHELKRNVEIALAALRGQLTENKLSKKDDQTIKREIARLSTEKFSFKRKRTTKKGKWTCTLHDVLATKSGPKIGEACSKKIQSLGLNSNDFIALRGYGGSIIRSLGGFMSGVETYKKIGYPVWSVATGRFRMELLTTKIERTSIDPKLFLPPKGYRNVGPTSRK